MYPPTSFNRKSFDLFPFISLPFPGDDSSHILTVTNTLSPDIFQFLFYIMMKKYISASLFRDRFYYCVKLIHLSAHFPSFFKLFQEILTSRLEIGL